MRPAGTGITAVFDNCTDSGRFASSTSASRVVETTSTGPVAFQQTILCREPGAIAKVEFLPNLMCAVSVQSCGSERVKASAVPWCPGRGLCGQARIRTDSFSQSSA